ncbi:ATP-binding protein [Streptomyces sp. NBC_01571]|uniref:ATP-binding protein n=1 Tax=Streptomyces sp. NBC_01571 TaxID=2975883 RepID=UPI00224F1707|nr:ATP-binding protein [Streptomyces sp. NBC_01571]MCX4577352.1 ATP-binding protein [Streptomyces sp. NBC_01571]
MNAESTRAVNAPNGSVNGAARRVNTREHLPSGPIGSTGHRTERGDEGGKKPPAAARIVAMAREQYRFVTSPDGRPYAVAIDGPNTALPLRNKGGLRQRLAKQFAYDYPGEVASQSALADAMTVLEGIAEDTDPVPVHLRVGRDPAGGIVVDLGSTDGRAVVVTATGWNIVDRAPVLFRRSGAMAPMPPPVLDGDGLAKLHALLNMDQPTFHQLVAWLVAAWIPDIPHPALVCKGEQGTGKSKAAQMFINLVDPSPASKRSQPRDEKAWSRQAFASWALCLDNVSTIPPWLSDTLCKAVTGDGVVDRALYTDDDVVVLTFKRVLALTTIDAGALAGDLAERVLLLDLQLIDSGRRRSEEELDATFAAVRPAVLGALFDVLACVLAVLPSVRLETMPRMADFARVLAAVDETQGWNTLGDYLATSENVATDALEGDPFAMAIARLVDQAGSWQGTAGQLLEALPAPLVRPPNWPKDPTRASGRVKRLAPLLRSIGITVDDTQRSRDRTRHKLLTLARAAPEDETASAPEQGPLWPEVAPPGRLEPPSDQY